MRQDRAPQNNEGLMKKSIVSLVGGKIANVHTISVNLNADRPSPQADDNGAIIR
jgi:hypothetical protein